MSHFCMWAVTKTDDEEELENIMQPYHEYECTGIQDQYVIHIDETEHAIEKFNENKTDYETATEFLEDWFGCADIYKESDKFNPDEEEDSYAVVSDDDKTIIKYVNYTNPNSKWDWWVTGGRWSDSKDVVIKKKDVNIDAMVNSYKDSITNVYNNVHAIFEKYPGFRLWNEIFNECNDQDKACDIYNAQQGAKEMNKYWLTDTEKRMIKDGNLESYLETKLKEYAPCFGIVTEDDWYESANMGWFGITTNNDTNWYDNFISLWNKIPDDYYIWTVDCHI